VYQGGSGGGRIYIFKNLCSHHVLNVFPKGVPKAPLFYPNYQLFYPIIKNNFKYKCMVWFACMMYIMFWKIGWQVNQSWFGVTTIIGSSCFVLQNSIFKVNCFFQLYFIPFPCIDMNMKRHTIFINNMSIIKVKEKKGQPTWQGSIDTNNDNQIMVFLVMVVFKSEILLCIKNNWRLCIELWEIS
jgi:hypothetical protein